MIAEAFALKFPELIINTAAQLEAAQL